MASSTPTRAGLISQNISFSQENLSTPSLFKSVGRGKVLSSDTKQVVVNVYSRVRVDNPKLTIKQVADITSKMTGVHQLTVLRVKSEYKKFHKPLPPRKSVGNDSFKVQDQFKDWDSFSMEALRRKVHEFFRRNEAPTLDKILIALQNDDDFPKISRSHLSNLLHHIGFIYMKKSRNSALIERQDLQIWRRQYLKDIALYRSQKRDIYFMDESWLNAGHTMMSAWVDSTIESASDAKRRCLTTGSKNPSGKGQRLIITHAGNENGFVDNALLKFVGKKTGDYHEEMNGDVFFKWFSEQLLPNIKPNSVIVLDNASYHSVKVESIPTSKTKKADILNWLSTKGIQVHNKMKVKELLKQVKQVRPLYSKYKIDEYAKEKQHTVLRLPPYHCELNPIEMVWGISKNYVAANNKTFKIKDVEVLFEEALQRVTEETWANCVEHVMKVEERFRALDKRVEKVVQPLIICFNQLSDDDDEDDEDRDTEDMVSEDKASEDEDGDIPWIQI